MRLTSKDDVDEDVIWDGSSGMKTEDLVFDELRKLRKKSNCIV